MQRVPKSNVLDTAACPLIILAVEIVERVEAFFLKLSFAAKKHLNSNTTAEVKYVI